MKKTLIIFLSIMLSGFVFLSFKGNDKAKKELQRIEYKNRTWIDDFSRKRSIWDEIALNFCSSKGKDLPY